MITKGEGKNEIQLGVAVSTHETDLNGMGPAVTGRTKRERETIPPEGETMLTTSFHRLAGDN